MMMALMAVVSMLRLAAALRDQSIAVKGRLTCGTEPASDVLVTLWDEDFGEVAVFLWFDPDDLLDESLSDLNGEFHLAGGTEELTAMEPVLRIYHDCNDGIKSGVRQLSFGLPDQYITAGLTPIKTVDVGVINLELSYKAEKRTDIVEQVKAEIIRKDP